MKPMLKIALLAPALILMFLVDVPPELPPPYVQLVPEAQAILGVRRRSVRRGVVVGAAVAGSEEKSQQSATAQQQSATAQQQSATAQQQSATAQQQAAAAPPPPPAAAGQPLPLGTVVPTLPAGCTSTPKGGVDYFYCGGNFYRAVFQGNNLVYVTAQP
jgi:hypothetical protein